MAGKNDGYSKVINDLISTCRDGEEGYLKAAKGVHDDDLRQHLTALANKHAGFASELQNCVHGDDVAQMGHGGGVLHAGWVELEQRIRPKDDSEIITNCLRGEDGVLKHYHHALESDLLPADVRALVSRQLDEVNGVIKDLQRAETHARSAV